MALANDDTMNENHECNIGKTETEISFMTNFLLELTIDEMRIFVRDNKRESILNRVPNLDVVIE